MKEYSLNDSPSVDQQVEEIVINFDQYYKNLQKKIFYNFIKLTMIHFLFNRIILPQFFRNKLKPTQSYTFNKVLVKFYFFKKIKLVLENLKIDLLKIDLNLINLIYLSIIKNKKFVLYEKKFMSYVPHLSLKLKLKCFLLINFKRIKNINFLNKIKLIKINRFISFFDKNSICFLFYLKFNRLILNSEFLNTKLILIKNPPIFLNPSFFAKTLRISLLFFSFCFVNKINLLNIAKLYKNCIKIKHIKIIFFKNNLDYFKFSSKRKFYFTNKIFFLKKKLFRIKIFSLKFREFNLKISPVKRFDDFSKIKLIKIYLDKINVNLVFFLEKFFKIKTFFRFRTINYIFFFENLTILNFKKRLIKIFNLKYFLVHDFLNNDLMKNNSKKFKLYEFNKIFIHFKKFRHLFFFIYFKNFRNKIFKIELFYGIFYFFLKRKIAPIFKKNKILFNFKKLSYDYKFSFFFFNFMKYFSLKKKIFIRNFTVKSFLLDNQIKIKFQRIYIEEIKQKRSLFFKKKFRFIRIILLVVFLIFLPYIFSDILKIPHFYRKCYRYYRHIR
jgi:hypothetical protein